MVIIRISREILVVFLVLIIFSNLCIAQDAKLFTQVIPPSPNASSLGKFADIPVGLYNGIPQISVPIYTIKVNDFSLPISLDYHASGVKVTEIPSQIGLGWALNAGGVITRTVHGTPDESNSGYLNGTYFPGAIPMGSGCISGLSAYNYDVGAAVSSTNDTEPDMFYFNFCGLSGSFVIDKSGNVHTATYSKVKFKAADASLSSWTVTGEDGTQYLFSTIEKTTSTPGGTIPFISSWYLTKISFPNNNQSITFSYNSENLWYDLPVSESHFEMVNPSPNHHCPPPTQPGSVQKITTRMYLDNSARISQIIFPGGTINFISGNYRYDYQGEQVIKQITINDNAKVQKTFNLNYNYFTSNATNQEDNGLATATTAANTGLRLCLKNVQVTSGDNTITEPPYIFTYYVPNVGDAPYLPDRLTSCAQDHWGYYNGVNSNTTLIPPYIDYANTYISGAQRQPVEEYAKTGTLCKIQYPTGGYTSFDYELNDAESTLLPNNIQNFSSSYTLGSCHAANTGSFVIASQTSNSTLVNLQLTGSPWTLSSISCGGTSPMPIASNPNSYIFFQIINITAPTSPQVVYTSSAGSTIGSATQNWTGTLNLPNGTYRIKAVQGNSNLTITAPEITGANANFNGAFFFNVTGYYQLLGTKKVGGLRVKTMTTYDPVTTNSLIKTYQYNDDTLSSGRVSYIPEYHHHYAEEGSCTFVTTEISDLYQFDVSTSFSNAPLTQMQGGNVGYGKVTVIEGTESNGLIGLNGKTEYYYTNPVDFTPFITITDTNDESNPVLSNNSVCFVSSLLIGTSTFPFAPTLSLETQRGLLTKQIAYKNLNNNYVKIKEIDNNYKMDYLGLITSYNSAYDVLAAKIGVTYKTYGDNPPAYKFATQYYYIPSRFSKLISTQETDYDVLGNNPVSSNKNYYYDNLAHTQLSRTVASNSDGTTTTTQNLYPLDYTNTTGFLNDMNVANIVDKPVEVVRYKTNGSTNTIIGGQIINYKAATSVGLPDKIYKLETVNPIPLSLFTFSNQSTAGVLPSSGSPGMYKADGHYPVVPNNSFLFDSYGNMTANTVAYGTTTSYQWGYNNTYPIAQASNAVSTDIFYDSFEEGDGNSTTGVAKTGHYSYNGSTTTYTHAFSNLDPGNYILSYWLRSPTLGTWSLVVTTVSAGATYTIPGISGQIDDVRFYPANSQMTTYTYDPLIGMTSSTDAKNETTYYEYDGLQRLMNVKDKDGNIIKHTDYHYQGQ